MSLPLGGIVRMETETEFFLDAEICDCWEVANEVEGKNVWEIVCAFEAKVDCPVTGTEEEGDTAFTDNNKSEAVGEDDNTGDCVGDFLAKLSSLSRWFCCMIWLNLERTRKPLQCDWKCTTDLRRVVNHLLAW